MAIENTVSIDFDPRSYIIDYVFDCRLPGVYLLVYVNALRPRQQFFRHIVTCVQFMKILTVYTLNSHLLTLMLEAHIIKKSHAFVVC